MDDFDIPIFKKAYDLYKAFYGYRESINKQDRHTIWLRSENIILDILEGILSASQAYGGEKLPTLEKVSVKLNLLRIFVRLMKETRTIDMKRYVTLETLIDEIGRMLGGWIKSAKGS
ncbi:MAG TPA: diversity-generating retroelement protein Avd [Candidatus Paceibacterota bacterium]